MVFVYTLCKSVTFKKKKKWEWTLNQVERGMDMQSEQFHSSKHAPWSVVWHAFCAWLLHAFWTERNTANYYLSPTDLCYPHMWGRTEMATHDVLRCETASLRMQHGKNRSAGWHWIVWMWNCIVRLAHVGQGSEQHVAASGRDWGRGGGNERVLQPGFESVPRVGLYPVSQIDHDGQWSSC